VTHRPALPYLLMILANLAFALMGALAHALRSRCDWQVIGLARAGLQLTLSLGLAWLAGVPLSVWRPGLLWVRSLAGSAAMMCMFFAYTRIPVANVMTLTNTFPIWVALLSWPLLGRAPSALVWLATFSGVLGVVLMQQPQLAEGNFASLVALTSSVFTAIAYLALHRLRHVDALTIIVHFSAVAAGFFLVCLFVFERNFSVHDLNDVGSILQLLSVGSAALVAQFLLTKAFALGEAAKVSVVGLTQIVFAMGFDVFFFDHSFPPSVLLGMALVLTPTAWLIASQRR
jgi:drug/metabolite transporter (DMT)-like permease